jgi:hypothetical protein
VCSGYNRGLIHRGRLTHLEIGDQTTDTSNTVLNILDAIVYVLNAFTYVLDAGMYPNHLGFSSQDRGCLE